MGRVSSVGVDASGEQRLQVSGGNACQMKRVYHRWRGVWNCVYTRAPIGIRLPDGPVSVPLVPVP
jgi:hypothetical protein